MDEDAREDRMKEVLNWALDHTSLQENLDSDLVVLGDPQLLYDGPRVDLADLDGRPWAILDLAGGSIIAVRGEAGLDGPWLFLSTTSDGPFDRLVLQPDLSDPPAAEVSVGSIAFPSGVLVAGKPSTVAEWGPAVAPADGQAASSMTGWEEPVPRHIGQVAVARVDPGLVYPVLAGQDASGKFLSVIIDLRPPSWTPPTLAP